MSTFAVPSSRGGGWLVLLFATAFVFTAGCSTMATSVTAPAFEGPPPTHSLIFVIHGDGMYSYRDGEGLTVAADRVTVDHARAVARENPSAEVLIFHEAPREKRFLFFSRPDGRFQYFRNGVEVYSDAFRRSGRDRLAPITRRVDAFASAAPVRMLFYFGHEIPEVSLAGYDASYPLRRFGIDDFARAIQRMTAERGAFDLITLATCHGGAPYTINTLSPHARYVLASPDNLHLSYLDFSPLLDLDRRLTTSADVSAFADTLARRSFDRLTASVHTTVSLAIYDTDRTLGFTERVASQTTEQIAATGARDALVLEHSDCAAGFVDDDAGISDGVTLYFRPARFGSAQHRTTHSGWMCWRPAQ